MGHPVHVFQLHYFVRCRQYFFNGYNSIKIPLHNIFISFIEPPVIDPFRIPAKKQGDRVTLSCVVASGDLPIHINWTKDGKDIPHDIGIIVEVFQQIRLSQLLH